MSDTTKTTSSTRRVLSNAKFMYLIPWASETSAPVVGSRTIYDISDIIADTVNIEQDDPEVNTTESEFSDSPLFENTKLGKYNFSATCVDTQNDILKDIFGWSEDASGDTKGAYAPVSYSYLYAEIVIGFANAVVVLPKVRLDSKLIIGTLKTGQAQSQISGTCYDAYVSFKASGADDHKCPIAIRSLAQAETGTTIAAQVRVGTTAFTAG